MMLERHLLKLIAALSVICVGLVVCVLLLSGLVPEDAAIASAAILVPCFVALGCVSLRTGLFIARLRRLVRLMLTGSYNVTLKTDRMSGDEVGLTERDINRFLGQLTEYDELRAARVRTSRRALEALIDAVPSPVLLVETEKQTLRTNPAFRQVTNTTQTSINLDALAAIDVNREFMERLNSVIDATKIPEDGTVDLQLPVQESAGRYSVRLIPVKGREDQVKQVLIIAEVV